MITSTQKDYVPLDSFAQSEANKLISEKQKILIIPHANVDPDGLSSALACYQFFTKLGKECTVICPDTLPESLDFLPGFEKLEQELDTKQDYVITLDCSKGFEVDKLRQTIEDQSVNIIVTPKKGALTESDIRFREGPPPYDLIVVVDTAELSLLGSLYTDKRDLFERVPILNIDHHISNTRFGQVQLINTACASATEILYDWFISDPMWKANITSDIATLLLTGLITDTRSFQNPNTTPRSLEVAAELLDLGARQQEIIKFIYKTKPLSTLKIWGRALNHIQVNTKEGIVWSTISKEDLEEMHATSKETHGIIDELLTTIPDANVYVQFTEIEEGGLKASMRSNENIDVSSLASKVFGGGGHARAAGFRVNGYDNFQLTTLECIQKIIEAIRIQRGDAPSKKPEVKEVVQNEPKKDQYVAPPTPVFGDNEDEGDVDVVKKLAS